MAPLGANESCGNCRLAEAVRVEEGKQNRGGEKEKKEWTAVRVYGKIGMVEGGHPVAAINHRPKNAYPIP